MTQQEGHDMNRLVGKVAMVTGASRGIGAAAAKRLAAEGAAVAVAHHPDAHMASLASEVVDEIVRGGGQAIAVGADVTDEGQVDAMFATAADAFGDVDVVIANAGKGERGPWHEISVDNWDRVVAINLRGTFLCAKAAYPGMRRKGSGAIVTVSSVMAHLGMAGSLAYVSAKAGIVGLTRALAREAGQEGIRVNCVMPGAIRTEQEEDAFPGQADELAAKMAGLQSLPQRGFAQDLAGTFAYLASDDAAFVTGQTILVDGGWANR